MRITKPVRMALALFAERGPMTARQFASLRWTDGFNMSVSAVGRRATGAVRGVGATLKAGAFLRRMRGAGLLSDGLTVVMPGAGTNDVVRQSYEITPEGREALAQANARAALYGRPGPRRKTA